MALALEENQIHVRFDQSSGQFKISVMSQDEGRAREIVREIVESAPPE
jgi:capsule polysaccharide export protein KpsE/RkpR